MYEERGCIGLPKLRVRNLTRGGIELADRADVANTSEKRRQGLLKHTGLEIGEGLWIVPCEAVHTFFMKFVIDVIFLNKKRQVVKIRENMALWRLAGSFSAHSVLELRAGSCARTGTLKGDQLELEKYDA